VANDTAVPGNRIERILAYMIASVAGVSIVAIIAVFIANAAGVDLSGGIWPAVAAFPLVGLTLAFVLIVVFTVVRVVRLRRDAADGS
jgi:hypothetical protein